MKYTSLQSGNGGSGRWRFKSTTVKAFILCLFFFSAVFITYQLIYYMNITEYQSQEANLKLGLIKSESGVGKNTQKEGYNNYDKFLGKTGGYNNDPYHPPYHPVGAERKKGKPLLSNQIVGVRPTDLHRYQDQQSNKLFQCFNSKKKIAWDKVNDDYCDCEVDGSDEPSTSACLNGKFYCVKRNGIQDFIPSSRVNDGICDCLNGEDEHASHVMCKVGLV